MRVNVPNRLQIAATANLGSRFVIRELVFELRELWTGGKVEFGVFEQRALMRTVHEIFLGCVGAPG